MAYKPRVLAVADGGTGLATLTAHSLQVGNGTTALTQIAVGTTGQVLQATTTADPTWSTPTYPSASGTSRTILVSNGTNNVYSTETWAVPGTSGHVLTSDGTNWTSAVPAAGGGTVTSVSGTANQVSVATGTTTPVISLVGPYTPATYTAHGVLIGEGTSSIVATATGSAGQVLLSGGASADPTYVTPTSTGGSLTVTTNGTTLNYDIANYADGTFTPTFSLATAGTSSFTYSRQIGRYSRVGNTVHVIINVLLTNFTVGTGSGSWQIGSLPYTVGNVSNQTGGNGLIMAQVTGTLLYYQYIPTPNSILGLVQGMTSASGTTTIAAGAISNTTLFSTTTTFFTS